MKLHHLICTLLFTLVALLSFSIWAAGSRFYSSEKGMYVLCAVVFLGLGGLALLPGSGIRGGRALAAFAGRFALGFALYAVIWSVAWFTFRNTFGEILGSSCGLLALVALLRPDRGADQGLLAATALVFFWHTLGYYAGGFLYDTLQDRGTFGAALPFGRGTTVMLARFAWGLCYGLGFGYGLVRVVHGPPRR